MVMPLPVNAPFRTLQGRPKVRCTGDALDTCRPGNALDPCLRLLCAPRELEFLLDSTQINEMRQWNRQGALAGSVLQKTVERIDTPGEERRGFRRALVRIRGRGRATDRNALERWIPGMEDIADPRQAEAQQRRDRKIGFKVFARLHGRDQHRGDDAVGTGGYARRVATLVVDVGVERIADRRLYRCGQPNTVSLDSRLNLQ